MTLGYSVETATGRVAAGETDNIFVPRNPRQGTCGVVLVHGSNAPQMFVDPAQKHSTMIASALASAGIPCIAGDFGGQTFGNSVVRSRIDSAWSVLSGRFPQMRTDKIALLGISMGGCSASLYAINNPTKVSAMVGIIPLLDLVAFYNYYPGTQLADDISDAWGVAHGAPLPAGADNNFQAPLTIDIPLLVGYSPADTLVHEAWVLGYTNQIPAATVIDLGGAGHTDATIGNMPVSTIGQFLTANGC